MSKTIRELLKLNDVPRLDKKAILKAITGFSDVKLITCDDYQLSIDESINYELQIERLKAGEPLAYILGFREFYSRNFKVSPATLIPRPETEHLVDEIIKYAPLKARILDLGTGTGCIAIICKLERPDLDVTAVDKFAATLQIAKENASNLNAKVNFIQSDWYTNLSGKFDLIMSNPPYIDVNDSHLVKLNYEPQAALTDFANGYTCIEKIAQGAKDYLEPGGILIIEHGYQQAILTQKILTENSFVEVKTIKDYANLDRITLGKLKSGNS